MLLLSRLILHPYFLGFSLAYIAAVSTLITSGTYSPAEPLFMLVIFGVILPSLAYFLCRKHDALLPGITLKQHELLITFILLIIVCLYLVWGSDRIDAVVYEQIDETPQVHFYLTIVKKLCVFVLLPFITLAFLYQYQWKDFGISLNSFRKTFEKRFLMLIAAFCLCYLAIQYLAGQSARPVFSGQITFQSLLLGGLILFMLQVIEVGLVEEFFFRAVLQTRIASWLHSELAGVLLMSLLFGLAHAPGYYLREAASMTSLGSAPDMVIALAYSVAIISLAGLAFGVIWAMTRNIFVLIFIHAWVDTIAGLADFLEIFPGLKI